ncbi:hypothetical protein ABZ897_29615 [Nonomuraea sp. NPDC046802]|uniref:hypothetical protein n=1 Tax=Nonomuraea sp. NPDC046802 TaxID=3154919 RepID=UPI0033D099AD
MIFGVAVMAHSEWKEKDELILHNSHLENVDFSGLKLRYLDIGKGSVLNRCNFSGLRVESWPTFGSGKQPTIYRECTFDGMVIGGGGAGRVTFSQCSFQRVKIKDYRFTDAEFIECSFSGILRSIIFSARPAAGDFSRKQNEFYGNDFVDANLDDVSFRGGIDLDRQMWPHGQEYFIMRGAEQIIARARQVILSWPNRQDRVLAEAKLDTLLDNVHGGQKDLFLARKSVSSGLSLEAAAQLVDLLKML